MVKAAKRLKRKNRKNGRDQKSAFLLYCDEREQYGLFTADPDLPVCALVFPSRALADRFRLNVEKYHPSEKGEWRVVELSHDDWARVAQSYDPSGGGLLWFSPSPDTYLFSLLAA